MHGKEAANHYYGPFETSGGTSDMIGNHSAGVVYRIKGDAKNYIEINAIRLVMKLSESVDATKFGAITALSNGVTLRVYKDTALELDITPDVITTNEDWEQYITPNNVLTDQTLIGDGLFRIPIVLNGVDDEFRITFDDDLTGCADFFKIYAIGNYGGSTKQRWMF